MKWVKKGKIKLLFPLFVLLAGGAFLALCAVFYFQWFIRPFWVKDMENHLQALREGAWFHKEGGSCYMDSPVEFYSAPEKFYVGQPLPFEEVRQKLQARSYTQASVGVQARRRLRPGWYMSLSGPPCEKHPQFKPQEDGEPNPVPLQCLLWRHFKTGSLYSAYFKEGRLVALHRGGKAQNFVELEGFLFAQYEGGQPVLKQCLPLEDFPHYCKLAVQAAEDRQFVLHRGVSFKSVLRALWHNLKTWRFSQGGSTITQQVVKNMFLSSKKTLYRKFKEQVMASHLEQRFNKDQILEMYMNIIYMGQKGAFRVHGLRAAALFYMGKPVKDLNASECALLAAVIKSPGRYSPFVKKNRERVLHRRNHILNTLHEDFQALSLKEWQAALDQPLPPAGGGDDDFFPTSPAIYFTDTVYKRLQSRGFSTRGGLKVLTTFSPALQRAAVQSVKAGLSELEQVVEKKGENLQVSLVSVDVPSGGVQAVLGGRDFKLSQFNRVLQSERQVGSLMKPVALLSALVQDPNLHPLSRVSDEPFTHTYENKQWTPKNYKNRYRGEVFLYEVLQHSLNAGTARLSLRTGLHPLSRMVKTLGGPDVARPLPSFILGAVEMRAWDVAQMFLTLARMGWYQPLHAIRRVQNMKGETLFSLPFVSGPAQGGQPVVSPQKTAVVVGMLKRVVQAGTARALKNFPRPLAGKTGTTNEEKDSWFVGFTPQTLTLVWLGFDDNSSHGLTGSEGALRVWKKFMTAVPPAGPGAAGLRGAAPPPPGNGKPAGGASGLEEKKGPAGSSVPPVGFKDFVLPEGVAVKTVSPSGSEGAAGPPAREGGESFSLLFEEAHAPP